MPRPLLRDIDAVVIGVRDLDAARGFYQEALGLSELWRDAEAVGLGVGGSGTEIVLHAGDVPAGPSVHYLVDDVPSAVAALVAAGARLVAAPFAITIGRCAVLEDPLGHPLAIVDMSAGPRRAAEPPAGAPLALREVTSQSVRDVCRIQVAPHQRGFVAPNAVSMAQAHFTPDSWFRAIHAGETLVGFVMLHLEPGKPPYLWRFMIAGPHQGKGFGRRALDLIVEHVRARPDAHELLLSCVPGPGSPEAFYRKAGFLPTGEVDEGELVMRLVL